MDHEAHNRAVIDELSNPGREDHARSVLDLIDVGTFDLDLASWLVAHVSAGASWVTGSGPGGVGKTTTMRSLLSFVPGDRRFHIALPDAIAPEQDGPHCAISLELSDHPPPGYLWDQNLRDFFDLADRHQIVGNVHADDLNEIHEQIVGDCRVPEPQFRAANLFVFICLEGGNPPGGRVKDTETRRVVNRIYYSDGETPHESVFAPDSGLLDNAPRDPERERKCRAFLEEGLRNGERTIAGVRERFLEAGI